jgi:hypothetical protein
VGSPQDTIDKALAQHELFGHSRILGQMDIGALPYAALSRSVELFAGEVAPVLRAATGADPGGPGLGPGQHLPGGRK